MVRLGVSANGHVWMGQHRTPTSVVGDGVGPAERLPRAGDGAGVVRANSSWPKVTSLSMAMPLYGCMAMGYMVMDRLPLPTYYHASAHMQCCYSYYYQY